jgi:hypothetical protein
MASDPDFIKASEIGEFVYCKRAWHLARHGAPSALAAERARGVEFHERHSEAVHAPPSAAAIAGWVALAALLLFALWAMWAFR